MLVGRTSFETSVTVHVLYIICIIQILKYSARFYTAFYKACMQVVKVVKISMGK